MFLALESVLQKRGIIMVLFGSTLPFILNFGSVHSEELIRTFGCVGACGSSVHLTVQSANAN